MIVVDIALFICIFMLGVGVIGNSRRLDLINEEVEDFIAETRELKQRCDGHKALIEALSKSVRELNGVVEAAVRVKEQTSDNKPDTKALIGGWTTDDGQARIDASHIRTIMMWHGRFVNECGRLADGTIVWGDKDGRLYVGDAKPYEMDQCRNVK